MPDPDLVLELDEARTELDGTKEMVGHAEARLRAALFATIKTDAQQIKHDLDAVQKLVREIPDYPSLDHQTAKREAIKQLTDMTVQLRQVMEKVAKLR